MNDRPGGWRALVAYCGESFFNVPSLTGVLSRGLLLIGLVGVALYFVPWASGILGAGLIVLGVMGYAGSEQTSRRKRMRETAGDLHKAGVEIFSVALTLAFFALLAFSVAKFVLRKI